MAQSYHYVTAGAVRVAVSETRELKLTMARADGQLQPRDVPGRRELEQEMTIDPSIVA